MFTKGTKVFRISLTMAALVGTLVLTACGQPEPTATRSDPVVAAGKADRLEQKSFDNVEQLLEEVHRVDPVVTASIQKPVLPKRTKFAEPKQGSELWWLAVAVYFEARSEPVAGQLKVAGVILNRRDDPRWPKTIEGVVRQGEEKRNRCQFSFMCDGEPERILNQAAWRKAVDVAKRALDVRERGVSMGCAHSYHANYVTSKKALRWFQSLKRETSIETHIFYCDPSKKV